MLGFPGFGQGGNPMPSEDPALPSDLAKAFGADTARDALTGTQKWALLSGELEGMAKGTIASVLSAVAKAATEAAQDAGQWAAIKETPTATEVSQQRAPSTSSGASTAAPAPETESPLRVREAAPGPDSGPAEDEPEYYHPVEQYREARQMAKAATMGTVAKAAMAPVAKAFSQAYDPWQKETIDGEQAWVQRDPKTKQITEIVRESDPDSGSQFRRIRRGSQAAALATGIASGSGVVGTLGSTVARVAGPIGIAIGGAQALDNFIVGQGQKATPYRQAFGEEDTGMFAARERFGESMAALGGFGTIGGDRARAQFQAASGMGLRGERREEATEFATEMYQRFGMETTAAMGLVQEAVVNGNGSLADFSKAIEDVSRAAVEAGRSSAEAIKDFAEAQSFVAKNVTGGAASIGVTQQIEQVVSGLDTPLAKSLGGVKGISGWFTQQNIQTVAMLSGQDPSAALWQMSDPATAEAAAGQFLGNIGEQIVRLMAQQMGMSTEDLKERVRDLTGGKRVGRDEQRTIFEELAGGTDQAAGLAQQVLQLVVGLFGIQIDYTQLLNLFFEATSGGLAPADTTGPGSFMGRAKAAFGGGGKPRGPGQDSYDRVTKPKGVSPLSEREAGAGGRAGRTSISTPKTAYEKQRFEILENLGFAGTEEFGGSKRRYMNVPSGLSEEINAYVDYVAKTGQGNPQIEALLKGSNRKELLEKSGASDAGDATFRLPGGRDMSLGSILKGGSQADMASLSEGKASVVNAETGEVVSVGDITNVRVQLEFTDEMRGMIRARSGSTEDQRSGTPAPSARQPNTYNLYGGR